MPAQNHSCGLGPIQTCKSGPKVAVLHIKNTQMRAGTHIDLSFWRKTRCFASKNHTWGLGRNFSPKVAVLNTQNYRWRLEPIETSNSGANHAVLHAQNDRWCLGPIEPCYSGANHANLHAQNDRWGLVPIETRYSGAKGAVLHPKTTGECGTPRD